MAKKTKIKKDQPKKNTPNPVSDTPVTVPKPTLPVEQNKPSKPVQVSKPAKVWDAVTPHRPFSVWVLIGIGLVGLLWWFYAAYTAMGSPLFGSKQPTAGTAHNTNQTVVTTTVPRRLDGVLVVPDKANFTPYAVMIENLLSTRPQSGLSQASVVYETLAEGGATRFLAVFDPSEIIPEIMPVRSARPYYIEWMSEYGALYAHAGGSPKALTVIHENADIHDLDALTRDGKYFWRDKTKGAPHNLVASSDKMNFALRDKALADVAATFTSWKFKNDAALTARGADTRRAGFNFSSGKTYKVEYQYVQADNTYLRFNADQPHLDKNTGKQIAVKNVIVQLVKEPTLAGEKGRLDIYVGGTGTAWIFRDGQAIKGTWQKNSRTERTIFYDADGAEIPFNRGSTWVHVIPEDQEVTYQ